MGKAKYEPPTPSFPYKIKWRLQMLSRPRKTCFQTDEGMPEFTPRGIRISALRTTPVSDRVNDVAWPYLRRLLITKRTFKNRFPPERIEKIDRMIEASNATCYSKFANCSIDLKKQDHKEVKKKKGWSESEWKKHMDYISQMASAKKIFPPPPVERGQNKPLKELLPRIHNMIDSHPDYKLYKRLSQEVWYRDPIKVPPKALKYQITERVRILAAPRFIPTNN